jgi:hypothetical protein
VPDTKEKINCLSQGERVLFNTYCKLVNQILYPEELEGKKLDAKDVDDLMVSVSDAVNPINVLRVIDVVMDALIDLYSEDNPDDAENIERELGLLKAEYLSNYLWEHDTVGFAPTTATAFFYDLDAHLQKRMSK